MYNTDYDAELKEASGSDVSAVEQAAAAVAKAVRDAGFTSELHGVHGDDLDAHFARLRDDPPDLVFNLVESMRGTTSNEPLFPAVLEMLEIAFTGPGPMCLRLCLHKDRSRDVLAAEGVTIPGGFIIRSTEDLRSERLDALSYPYFVKLSREDASIGIEAANVAADSTALVARATALLRKYKQPVVAEQYISGREVNVTVIGNGDEIGILPLHEIDFGKMPEGSPHIVSYAAKWDEDHPDYRGTLPVPLVGASPEVESEIERTAIAAFNALELRDFARVDLRIDDSGTAYVIDVNPNCDLSSDAGVARAALAGGLEYHQLIGRICEIAWRRHEQESANDQTARAS